ncbi:MAG: hypothetical protein HKP12_15665 [Gammaproteobacteria bacterium]|nr:hypothetical protein [Gammaproteobacteria bacterium]NNJ98586.1 hypothetical protein [Gammaproteobacteria bacterium]
MFIEGVTRKQAFLAHLLISVLVFVVVSYFIIFQWYASYYFHIDGGYRGIATIFLVDIVLGPGLTLLVFRPGKPGLKFDMATIIILQILALGWGIGWVYSERPALTVFYDGEFICMKHSEVSDVDLDRLALKDKGQPLLAVLPRPNTYLEYQKMLTQALEQNSASIYIFGEKFLPMDVVGTFQIMNYTLDVANSLSGDGDQIAEYREIWNQYLRNRRHHKDHYMYFPLSCRYGRVLAVFDPEVSEIVDYVPVCTTRAVSRIKLGFTRDEIERYKQDNNLYE